MSASRLPSIGKFVVLALFALAPVWIVQAANSQRATATVAPQGGAQKPEAGRLGVFTGQKDVGTVLHPGSGEYDSEHGEYTVSGSGENMWFGEDDFHFLWRRLEGDVAINAEIAFVGAGGNPHRKAVLMIRQSLDAGSPAVDLAVHGVGLTSLQYRDAAGANMHEVQSNVSAPTKVRIEKRGDFFYAFASGKDGKLQPTGAATKLVFTGPFYVGIGVCAHDKNAVEKAVFSRLALQQLKPVSGKNVLVSTLETVNATSTDRHVEYVATAHFEAPNWTHDGSALIFNQDGTIRRLAFGGDDPDTIATAPQIHCNNDHGISPDGQMLAISDRLEKDGKSRVYVVPLAGGMPKLVTKDGPSYWHGWTPDGKTLAFTGERGGNFDIYTIPVSGGKETRLTTATGLDDGPEYSPDGAYIYFNSERSGHMQIWRMKSDGTEQEEVITDESNDWFPHISPDGQWMVFVAYEKGVTGHPADKDVELRLMSMADKKVHLLAKLFGGQGTINVPSWSPDSKRLAFVSYAQMPEESLSEK